MWVLWGFPRLWCLTDLDYSLLYILASYCHNGIVRLSILHLGEQPVFADEAMVHVNWEEPNRLARLTFYQYLNLEYLVSRSFTVLAIDQSEYRMASSYLREITCGSVCIKGRFQPLSLCFFVGLQERVFIPMAFLLAKVCTLAACSPPRSVCLYWIFCYGLLWVGQNGLPPTPDTLHLGCSYHLHSSHRFLSTWGAVMLEKVLRSLMCAM